jgi:hypothetical protein
MNSGIEIDLAGYKVTGRAKQMVDWVILVCNWLQTNVSRYLLWSIGYGFFLMVIEGLEQGSDFSGSPGQKFRPGTQVGSGQVGADPTWKSRRPYDPQNFFEKTQFFM